MLLPMLCLLRQWAKVVLVEMGHPRHLRQWAIVQEVLQWITLASVLSMLR